MTRVKPKKIFLTYYCIDITKQPNKYYFNTVTLIQT